jgi:TonB-dependent receptor
VQENADRSALKKGTLGRGDNVRSSIRARRLLVAGASLGVLCALAAPVAAQDKSAAQDASAKDGKTVETVTEVVVTARRKALQTAIEIKRNADTIVDSIVADEAGKLPDNSITEVLQRVSGVSISRFTGTNGGNTAFQIEGSGITVRGLPFNSSTLNGQQLFSANGASAISWNEVTPELMAGVDVYKATRADLIEGGASSIDLRTHLPFDFRDTQFNVTAGGSYGTLAKKASPRVSAMYSKRFDTNIGEFGVLWDLAYSRLNQQRPAGRRHVRRMGDGLQSPRSSGLCSQLVQLEQQPEQARPVRRLPGPSVEAVAQPDPDQHRILHAVCR